jgi:hypothetical protein
MQILEVETARMGNELKGIEMVIKGDVAFLDAQDDNNECNRRNLKS